MGANSVHRGQVRFRPTALFGQEETIFLPDNAQPFILSGEWSFQMLSIGNFAELCLYATLLGRSRTKGLWVEKCVRFRCPTPVRKPNQKGRPKK